MTPRLAPAAPEPLFRRPTPEDAVAVGRELLDAGERVDVLAVARRLGVSRATMHRWFGTRDQLVTDVLDGLAREFIATAEDDLDELAGDERMFAMIRGIADLSSGYRPLWVAVQREPSMALRLLLASDGPVRRRVIEAVERHLAETRTPAQLARLHDAVRTFVDAAMALHWARIAAGEEPDTARYADLGRALLADAA